MAVKSESTDLLSSSIIPFPFLPFPILISKPQEENRIVKIRMMVTLASVVMIVVFLSCNELLGASLFQGLVNVAVYGLLKINV